MQDKCWVSAAPLTDQVLSGVGVLQCYTMQSIVTHYVVLCVQGLWSIEGFQ